MDRMIFVTGAIDEVKLMAHRAPDQLSALSLAIAAGGTHYVRRMIAAGLYTRECVRGCSHLHVAVKNAQYEIADILLDETDNHSVDEMVSSRSEFSCLSTAIFARNPAAVEYYVRRGAAIHVSCAYEPCTDIASRFELSTTRPLLHTAVWALVTRVKTQPVPPWIERMIHCLVDAGVEIEQESCSYSGWHTAATLARRYGLHMVADYIEELRREQLERRGCAERALLTADRNFPTDVARICGDYVCHAEPVAFSEIE